MTRLSAVEVSTTYATTVATLADAWAFVMDHVDGAGDAPTISIAPFWSYAGEGDPVRAFEVSVNGSEERE